MNRILVMKPGIAAGVAVAGLAGMVLAGRGITGPLEGFLAILCILMAATGSAIMNVVLEADTDALMPRVRARGEALARLGNKWAVALSLLLVTASLALSFIYINKTTGLLILTAVLSYTLLYTLYFKRRSPYGTVLGGIPGALPVLIGYASVKPSIGMDGVILFIVMLLWQPPHFLALALKHSKEYEAAGIPVMPVVLGEPYTESFMFIYGSALVPLTLSLWVLGYCSEWFAAFSSIAGLLFLMVCYISVVRTKGYGHAFGASIMYIMAVLIGVIVDVGIS